MGYKIVVCGSGNVGHIVAGIAGGNAEIESCVYTKDEQKAIRWHAILEKEPLIIKQRNKGVETTVSIAHEVLITSEAEEAARNCDMIILAVPAFVHADYLKELAPFMEDGVVIVGFPGQNGFEFETSTIVDLDNVVLMNFDSSPWSCRIQNFGSNACIVGRKAMIVAALRGDLGRSRIADPFSFIRELLCKDTKVVEASSMLAVSLMSINAYSHPAIMYYFWKNWDGKPLKEIPLFYQSIQEETANFLTRISEEGQRIGAAVKAQFPEEDMSTFLSMFEWDLTRYSHMIEDHTDQLSVLRTNRSYDGMLHPMIEVEGGFIPNFKQRFLSEDVPYGLVPVRGIAEIVGVKTLLIDEILEWSQAKLEKEYLVNGEFIGKDIKDTRAPQNFGYSTLNDIIWIKSALLQ